MKSANRSEMKYELARKISEDHFIISYLAKKNGKKFRLFNFPTKDDSYPIFIKSKLLPGNISANIPTIIDSGELDNGTPYIAIPYQKSSTLRNLLSKNALEVNKILKFGLALISQINEAHLSGLVNFRLRPEDIFVTEDGKIKIFPYFYYDRSDLLEMISIEKQMTDVLYIAPEQIKNSAISKASDYYSLGIIFYEMLFAMVPFYDEKNVEVLKLHLESKLPEPEHFPSDEHRKIFEITKLLLNKDPDQRLGYAAQIENELLKILHQDVRSWNSPFVNSLKAVEKNIPLLSKNSEKVKNEIIKKSGLLDLLQGSFFWILSESGYPIQLFLQNLIRAFAETTSNIVFVNPFKRLSSSWQGISIVLNAIMENVKIVDEKVYENYLKSSVVNLLSEKDYKSTIYSEEQFSTEEILKQLTSFFESVAIWSPFILIIQEVEKLDQKSRDFLLLLSKKIPDISLLFLFTASPEHPAPVNAEKIELNGLTRVECVELIQRELGINEKEALLIYNKIVIKSGNMVLNIRLFLHWLKTHPDKDEKIPVSIIDLLRKKLLALDEQHLKMFQKILSWPFPPARNSFSQAEQMTINDLEKNFYIVSEIGESDRIVPYHRDFAEVLNRLFPAQEKFNELAAQISSLLEKRPWFWGDYLGNLHHFNKKGIDILLRSVDYYLRLNCYAEAISLLDIFLENFPDFQDDLKINQKYLNIYLQIGSYDAAQKYLKHVISENPDNISFLLQQLFLFIKRDKDFEAEKLISRIEKLPDISEKERAVLNFNIAQLLAREHKDQSALKKFASSRKQFSALMDLKSLQDVLKAEVSVLKGMGRNDKTMELLNFGKKISAHANFPDFQFWLLKQMGDISLANEDFLKAAEYYQEAFEIPKTIQSEDEYARFQFNRGGLQWFIGDNQTALQYFQDAAERFDKLGYTKDFLKSLGNQAVVLRETGQLGMALVIESKVLEMARSSSEKDVLAVSLNSLGYIYNDVNQLQNAKECFDTVISLSKENGDEIERYRAYLGKASVYLKEGLHNAAGKLLEKAKNINPDNLGYLRNDLNYFLGRLAYGEGSYNQSLKYVYSFLKSTRISFKYQAIGKYLLAENQNQRGEKEDAMQRLGESFNLARIAGLDPVMQKVLWLKSQIHFQNKEIDKAKKSLDQCIMLIHKISGSLKSEIDQLIYKESMEFSAIFEWHKNHFSGS